MEVMIETCCGSDVHQKSIVCCILDGPLDANIKLTSYLSDIFSKTGLTLLTLFINGETIEVDTVSSCIHKRVKPSPKEHVEAMNGKLSIEDRFLLDQSLEEYRMYQELIEKLIHEIQDYITNEFPVEYQLLLTIPGVSESCAATVLAEIGPSVDAFETDGT